MRGCLIPTARAIQVHDGAVTQHTEHVGAAGRNVDVTGRRSRRGKEHVLRFNKVPVVRL